MWRTRSIMVLVALLWLTACSGSDDSDVAPGAEQPAATASPEPVTTAGPDADSGTEEAAVATDGAPATAGGEGPRFATSTDDPVYVDLLLDCVFGENEAASCEQLEAAGLAADDAYGLGNSLTQAPSVALREDCLAGAALSCAELNGRVDTAILDGEGQDPDLLCLFHAAVREGAGSDLDTFQLQRLLGRDAPPGVVAAVERLAVDNSDPDSLEALTGYLDPVCAAFLG